MEGNSPAAPSYRDQSLGDFLDLVAKQEPAPGGGSVAAVTVSLAAALVEMAANYAADQIPDGSHLAVAANTLRHHAAELADLDAQVYQQVIAAYATEGQVDPGLRGDAIRQALQTATEVPLEIAQVGVETAVLAARLVVAGRASVRGDAMTAVLLAEAGVRSAAQLVGINVGAGGLEARLLSRAEGCVDRAADAVKAAFTKQGGDGD